MVNTSTLHCSILFNRYKIIILNIFLGIEQETNSSLIAETLTKIPPDLPSNQQELNSDQSQQKSTTPMVSFT